MNDASVTQVLILAEAATGRAWEGILCGPQLRVWLGREAIPPSERPDIILAHSRAPQAAARDEVGVVLVGGSGPADVALPEDCAGDELRRACLLLGEIVRLRRRERHATQRQRELAVAAMTDPLTGLANRRAWDCELSQRTIDCGPGRWLCLAVLDFDRFKQVNDTAGHAAGDELLRQAGRAMQRDLRHEDFVARLGGDEFGLLLWAPGEAAAAAIVERVRRKVASAADEAGFHKVSASAGFALCGPSPTAGAAEALFLAADAALIAAKRAGRDRTCSPNLLRESRDL